VNKIITLGEILMRLSPPGHLRFDQTANFDVQFGGAEFNVAASLSNFEMATEFVSVVPNNDIGNCAIHTIKKYGVGHEYLKKQGERLGIYFLENGTGNRNSKVVYDRANSSISKIQKGTFDWEQIFEKSNWFHWSGITPAISADAAAVCLEAIQVASQMGLTISTDLNYRSKLWKYGKEPHEVMPDLLAYSHVILGDVDTMMLMLGKEAVEPDYKNEVEIQRNFDRIMEQLPNLKTMGMTIRNIINASHQKIGGLLYKDGVLYQEPIKEVSHIVDRVGTGDAFMAGLIYGLINFPDDLQKVISFATNSCILKHSVFGDVHRTSADEVYKAMNKINAVKVDR